jgi:hypothetical protein
MTDDRDILLVAQVVRAIQSARVDLSDEKAAQIGIAGAFEERGLAFAREVRIAPGSVLDFMIDERADGGIAVELKMRRAVKRAIYRQIERYCAQPRIRALVLCGNLAMGLPREIAGKPVYLASLGRGWL